MNHGLFAIPLAFALSVPAASREEQSAAYTFLTDSSGIIRIADNGATSEPEFLKPEPPTPWVRSVVRELTSGKYDWAMGEDSASLARGATGIPSDPVPQGQIRVAFRQIGQSDHRLLVISNGYDRALAYRAYIRVKGKDQYTDVCTVMPGMHAFEHWPYAADAITLVDLRLETWRDGQPPRCE